MDPALAQTVSSMKNFESTLNLKVKIMSIMDRDILNYEALAGMDLEGEDTVNASWHQSMLPGIRKCFMSETSGALHSLRQRVDLKGFP